MILQLDPPIWLETPKGDALCHFVIEMGIEMELYWVCFVQKTREIWTYSNVDVKAIPNITAKRAARSYEENPAE